MELPKLPPLGAEIVIKIDRQSILILALSMACVVAFGILLSRVTK